MKLLKPLAPVRLRPLERGSGAPTDASGDHDRAEDRVTPQARFAQRLKTWRLAAGLKQDALAAALGLGSRTSISQWERGINRPELTLLPRLAVVLGVSFREILEAWWGIELPPIASAEGVVLSQRARRLSQRDRQRLTTLIDAWVLPRNAVEAFAADRLRQLVDALDTLRAEAHEHQGDGS